MGVVVMVGGWPGSGRTTSSRSLALELGLACLGKDEAAEALMAALGTPEELPRGGRGQRLAPRCPPAATGPAGACVEVRCVLPHDLVRARA